MLSPNIAENLPGSSIKIKSDELQEVKEHFESFCEHGNDFVTVSTIHDVLLACGEKVPPYKIRQKLPELDLSTNEKIYFQDFMRVYEALASQKICTELASLTRKPSMQVTGGASCVSSQGTQHSYDDDDKTSFAEWINGVLQTDRDVASYLPIDADSPCALFKALKDGIILCKLVNWASPGTIDERAINKTKLNVYTIHENLTLSLNSASSIGCHLINIGPEDVLNGTPHLVLGLIWQIIRIGLFATSGVKNMPGLQCLLENWETEEDLKRMTPEEILMRWVNYHLKRAGSSRTIKNFASHLKDSEVYAVLLKQISPKDNKLSIELTDFKNEADVLKRAQVIINAADELKCRRFIKAHDIVNENYRMNLAFLCNCFKLYPGLETQEDEDGEVEEQVFETREEKTFRNWINSLGVEPFVSDLRHELEDGWILLQVLNIISERKPPIDVNAFNKPPFKRNGANMKRFENCNHVIRLCTEMNMSAVGIAGSDIVNGNIKLTLAIIWQMMKLYTLSLLQKCSKSNRPIQECQIVQWANGKLANGGKQTRITGFKDQSISTSIAILDLIDVLRPKSVNYSLVRAGNDTHEKLLNANYAISLARKIGAKVYALPEDIVEVKSRMVMTVFACLMAREKIEGSKQEKNGMSLPVPS